MNIDKAIKTIVGYCNKHTFCFETDDGTIKGNITTKCKFYSEKFEDCALKQCPADWLIGKYDENNNRKNHMFLVGKSATGGEE